jgi:hypothetical protein
LKRVHKFWGTAVGIQIVIAQQHRAAASPRALSGDPKRAGVAEVE